MVPRHPQGHSSEKRKRSPGPSFCIGEVTGIPPVLSGTKGRTFKVETMETLRREGGIIAKEKPLKFKLWYGRSSYKICSWIAELLANSWGKSVRKRVTSQNKSLELKDRLKQIYMDNIRKRSKEQLVHESPILQWNCEDSQSGFCFVTDLQNYRYFWNKWDIPISKLSSKTHLQESHQKKWFELWLWVLQPEYFQIFQPSKLPSAPGHFENFGHVTFSLGISRVRSLSAKANFGCDMVSSFPIKAKKWRRFAKFKEAPVKPELLSFGWWPPHPPKWSPDGMKVFPASGHVACFEKFRGPEWDFKDKEVIRCYMLRCNKLRECYLPA